MEVARKSECCSFCAPPRQAGISISAVADHCQIIRNRLWPDSELLDDSSLVAHDLAPSIALHHSRADDALGQIFVGCTNYDLAHMLVLRCVERRGSESIVGLEVDHWPDENAHRLQRLLHNGKLREQLWRDAFAGFVALIKLVSKRLDYVVSRNSDMSRALFDHRQHRSEHAASSSDFLAARIGR